jgi:hypothetical protein
MYALCTTRDLPIALCGNDAIEFRTHPGSNGRARIGAQNIPPEVADNASLEVFKKSTRLLVPDRCILVAGF